MFRATISIRKRDTGKPISYKDDGQRYMSGAGAVGATGAERPEDRGSERTLKLNCDTQYEVRLSVRPRRLVSAMSMGGHKLTLVRSGTTNNAVTSGGAACLDSGLDCEDSVVYDAIWNALTLNKTHKGRRTNVPVDITFTGHPSMKIGLQSKIYPSTENSHSGWGAALAHVELELKAADSKSPIVLIKQTVW